MHVVFHSNSPEPIPAAVKDQAIYWKRKFRRVTPSKFERDLMTFPQEYYNTGCKLVADFNQPRNQDAQLLKAFRWTWTIFSELFSDQLICRIQISEWLTWSCTGKQTRAECMPPLPMSVFKRSQCLFCSCFGRFTGREILVTSQMLWQGMNFNSVLS